MSTFKILSAIIVAMLFGITDSRAAVPDSKHISDSLFTRLAKVKTPSDSVVIMWNLFDVLPRDKGSLVGLDLFNVANRAGDTGSALEILRNLGNRYIRNDSMLVELYNRTLRYSDNPDDRDVTHVKADELKETRTFLRMMRNMHRARYAEEDKRNEILHEQIKTNTLNPPEDIYDQVVLFHSICAMLVRSGSDELLTHYLDSLGSLINKLPGSAMSIHNAYNVHASILYANNNQFNKSMMLDKNTLEVVDRLEKEHHERGRIYRNFDANRYLIYQRFLSNYHELAPHEIEKYYKRAMEFVRKDFTSSETNRVFPGPQIYYNMAYKKYAAALELIKNCIDDPQNRHLRLNLLKYEIECAEALGDNATLLSASREYSKKIEEYLDSRIDEKYKDLQVIYDTYDIRNNYKNLQIEKQRAEAKAMRSIITTSIVAMVILLVSVIILFRLYRKNRSLVHRLNDRNSALRTESDNLEKSKNELLKARDMAQKANNLKTDFIKNMSYEVKAPLKAINEYCKLIVDCSDASNKKYLERFSSLVELNSELLSTIVNDVLHISEIDSDSVPVHNRPVELRQLCSMVLDGVRHRLQPGVALQFDTASPDISLFTDPQRVHQILLNILTNAAKFTAKGSITLAYKVNNEKETVTFSVTDTGIGIKPDKKEEIFGRFVKLDKDTQGAGLGLTISRLLARLLGGDVELDTSYNRGARFLLVLPKK